MISGPTACAPRRRGTTSCRSTTASRPKAPSAWWAPSRGNGAGPCAPTTGAADSRQRAAGLGRGDWLRAVVTMVACSPTATTSGWKLRVTVSRGRSTVTEIIAASGRTVRNTPTNSTSVRPKTAEATSATAPTAPSAHPRAVGRGRFSGDEARPRFGTLAPRTAYGAGADRDRRRGDDPAHDVGDHG